MWDFLCELLPYLAVALGVGYACYESGRRDEADLWSDCLSDLPYHQQRAIAHRYQQIDGALNRPRSAQEGRQ